MKTLSLLVSLAIAAPAVMTSSAAQAQDVIDIDSGDPKEDKKKKRVRGTDEIVREIERGFYLKANAGLATYLLRYGAQPAGGNLIRAGSVVAISVGNDFVDEPNRSMAWDLQFYQGVHNGMPFDQQVPNGVSPTDHLQGDIRAFAFLASYEFSAYPTRRLGIGFRAGAGVMFLPLLMPRQYYDTIVRPEWGNANPNIHSTPHFPVFAGPTIEYYTKLSHFSLGVDVDGTFVVGMNDLGINATGFMKYTF